MGFFRGFTGGVTLTLGLAFIATQVNARSRLAQSTSLQQQDSILQSLLQRQRADDAEPASPYDRAPRGASLTEMAKDKWNAELAANVRTLQTTDWDAVRDDAEAVLVALYRRATGGEAAAAVGSAVHAAEDAADKVKGAVVAGVAVGKDAVQQAVAVAKEEKGMTDVQRALAQRYQKSEEPEKTKEEILAARYRPIDS